MHCSLLKTKTWSCCSSVLPNILVAVLLMSCGQSAPEVAPPTTSDLSPKVTALGTGAGYVLNQVSGDSIDLVLNSLGDTIGCCLTALATPTLLSANMSGDMVRTRVHKAPSPVKAFPNRKELSGTIGSIPILGSSLKRTEVRPSPDGQPYINSVGKAIRTKVPVPAKWRIIPITFPEPVEALPPRMKDNAMVDLQYLDVDQHLPSSYITRMIEDKNRNLWFGTHGGGLCRYDGETFITFTEASGLPSVIIRDLLLDSRGNIWMGTQGGGLCMYNGESFLQFSAESGLLGNSIMAVAEDSKSNIWFGYSVGGISSFDGESFTHYTEEDGLSAGGINCIMEDSDHQLWVSTNTGITRFDGSSFFKYSVADGLAFPVVQDMLQDAKGNYWLATTGGGVQYFEPDSAGALGGRLSTYTTTSGLSSDYIFSIHEDSDGTIWCGTHSGGVCKFDGRNFTRYSTEEGLTHDLVWYISSDDAGNLWCCTSGGGVCRLNPNGFTRLSEKNGLGSDYVMAIHEDSQGNIWLGGRGGGLSRFDGENITTYSPEHGLSHDIIRSIHEDASGNIWSATLGGGLCRFDGMEFARFDTSGGLRFMQLWTIEKAKDDVLWCGSNAGGLLKIEGDSIWLFTDTSGLSSNRVLALFEDSRGLLWIGSRGGGVSSFDGKSFTHYTESSGLCSNHVQTISEDDSGNLWFGSYGGGIDRFDGRTFTHFTTEQGLSNDKVWSVLWKQHEGEALEGFLATESGLDLLSLAPSASNNDSIIDFSLHSYNSSDGIASTDFYMNSVILDRNNRAWWGGGKALESIELEHLRPSSAIPIPFLTHVSIKGRFIDFRQKEYLSANNIVVSSVMEFSNLPLGLCVPFNQNHLTFHFSAIDWAAQEKVVYQTMVEGLDDDWSVITSKPLADYRNIPGGEYIFKVRSMGESQQWSQAFMYHFTVNPPWRLRWWAFVIYIAFAAIMVFVIVRWNGKRLRQANIQLEGIVANRTEEIRKERDRSEELLLNILPEEVAGELKEKGAAEAKLMENVTVLFTDFKGFTAMSEQLSPKELVKDLHECFSAFDRVCEKYGIEKIKTIGDAYMAAGGLPTPTATHAQDVVKAALEMKEVVEKGKRKKVELGLPYFEIRIGIHTGPVVAGIVGVKKFQYDIWGDTVNTASRMESSGEVGKVNVSESTYTLVKDQFSCNYRGEVKAKGKGKLKMYFVEASD